MIDILYQETQGITDLAVKAYLLAQERAIDTKEMITASIIRSVCRDKFRMLQPAIEALKAKTKNALTRFEDAYPQFLEQFIENSVSSNRDSKNAVQVEGEIASDPIIRSVLNRKKISKKSYQSSKKEKFESINEKSISLKNLRTWVEKTENIEAVSSNSKETILPKILASLNEVNSKTIHTALKEKGFIKSAVEFISGDITL